MQLNERFIDTFTVTFTLLIAPVIKGQQQVYQLIEKHSVLGLPIAI